MIMISLLYMSDAIPLRLAVDFDGVCHDPSNVPKGYKLGQPVKGAQEALQGLKKDGAIIVIHSVWADTDERQHAISEWLRYFHIPYDFITNIKPNVDFYIDDKSIHHTTWSNTLAEIERRYHP
jgi:hypothetical protein